MEPVMFDDGAESGYNVTCASCSGPLSWRHAVTCAVMSQCRLNTFLKYQRMNCVLNDATATGDVPTAFERSAAFVLFDSFRRHFKCIPVKFL